MNKKYRYRSKLFCLTLIVFNIILLLLEYINPSVYGLKLMILGLITLIILLIILYYIIFKAK